MVLIERWLIEGKAKTETFIDGLEFRCWWNF